MRSHREQHTDKDLIYQTPQVERFSIGAVDRLSHFTASCFPPGEISYLTSKKLNIQKVYDGRGTATSQFGDNKSAN